MAESPNCEEIHIIQSALHISVWLPFIHSGQTE